MFRKTGLSKGCYNLKGKFSKIGYTFTDGWATVGWGDDGLW